MSQIVRILQHEFLIDREYPAGHIIDEFEAAALNQLLVENVRNNVYSWVTRAAEGRGALTAAQQAELSDRINDYANNYQFRTRLRNRPQNPLRVAIRDLAWHHAEAWAHRNGHDADGQQARAHYIALLSDPAIHNEARQIIIQRQAVVNKALEGII